MLLKLTMFVCTLVIPVVTTQAQTPPANKPTLLQKVEQNLPESISRVLAIQGVNENGKEVVARLLVPAREFDRLLLAEPNIVPDMFWPMGSHVGPHKHAWKSRRTKGTHQSLQYTIYRSPGGDYVEMDIDRDCPQWTNPVATAKHLALEIVPNWVDSKILRRKPNLPNTTGGDGAKSSEQKE